MRSGGKTPATAERLRASPNFALAFAPDGRPYVAKDSEPYIQYWLTERYRVLLSLFSGRHGATEADAIEAYHRLTRTEPTKGNPQGLSRAIGDMRQAGVLIGARDDLSRYDAGIAADYVAYRPFPREISDRIIDAAPVVPTSRVLDLAGGPGDLALALARVSGDVSLMELSRGFLTAAATRARNQGLTLTTRHESCNRLVYQDGDYDVITVSQALHWLDDVMVCRGVCRLLRPGGGFFVVHAAFDVSPDHPLSHLLGKRSILGGKADRPFADEVAPLLRRLTLLFDALDAPDVDRIDLARTWGGSDGEAPARIVPAGTTFFRQRRPMGLGFARAFLTPRHIEATGQTPEQFWRDTEARCAAATPTAIEGTFDWALLHFRRGGAAASPVPAPDPVTIGYDGPPEA